MDSTLKRIWGFLVVIVLAFIPNIVTAEEVISYLEYSNVASNENRSVVEALIMMKNVSNINTI